MLFWNGPAASFPETGTMATSYLVIGLLVCFQAGSYFHV